MKLQEITEPGEYWAIDKNGKHHACDIMMICGMAVPVGLDPTKIRAYIKRNPVLAEIQYRERKKIY